MSMPCTLYRQIMMNSLATYLLASRALFAESLVSLYSRNSVSNHKNDQIISDRNVFFCRVYNPESYQTTVNQNRKVPPNNLQKLILTLFSNPAVFLVLYSKIIIGNPYLKILDFSQLFVTDAPMKKTIKQFNFTPSQSTFILGR